MDSLKMTSDRSTLNSQSENNRLYKFLTTQREILKLRKNLSNKNVSKIIKLSKVMQILFNSTLNALFKSQDSIPPAVGSKSKSLIDKSFTYLHYATI